MKNKIDEQADKIWKDKEICYADPFGLTKCYCKKCKKKEEKLKNE